MKKRKKSIMGKALGSNSSSTNKIVVKNADTEYAVLTQTKRPEPEFKDKTAIIGKEGVLLKSEQVFVCPEPGCGALFALEKSLNLHVTVGHLDRYIKCGICGSCFKSPEEKTKHLTNFHPNLEKNPDANLLECQKCKKVCTSPHTLNRHIRRCHPDEIFNCPHCNGEYRRKEAMLHHIKRKHFSEEEGKPKPSYPCELCNLYFHCPGDRRRHYRSSHRSSNDSDKRYRCVICDTIYYSKAVYRSHLRIHTSGKAFTCDICNVSFMTKGKLVRHEASGMHKLMLRKRKSSRIKQGIADCKPVIEAPTKTLQELKEMCPEDLYEFCWQRVPKVILFKLKPVNVNMTPARNERDLRHFVADEEKRFYFDLRCVDCKTEFQDKEVLKSHEKNCPSVKREVIKGPHKCEACGKIFKKRCQLNKHNATHSDARPFKCNYCDSAFKCKVTQIAHEKHVHFGFVHKKPNRVFTCNYNNCGKTYNKDETLRKHVRSIHLGVRLKCEEPGCVKSFKSQRALAIHRESKHIKGQDQVLIECKPCMRTFKHRVHFKAHCKKPRHILKMKYFRDWEDGEKEALEQE